MASADFGVFWNRGLPDRSKFSNRHASFCRDKRIRGFTTMRYINRLFTYLLTYLLTYEHLSVRLSQPVHTGDKVESRLCCRRFVAVLSKVDCRRLVRQCRPCRDYDTPITTSFLSRSATLDCDRRRCPSVCLSGCLSQAGTVGRQMLIRSRSFHRKVAQGLRVF